MSATGVGNGRIRRARSRVLSRAGASRRLHEEGRASSGRAPQGQRASGGARSSVCLTDQMNWSQKHVSCNVPHGGIWGERPRFPRFEYGATTEVGTRSEFTYDRWWVLVGLQQAVGPAWNLRRLVCDWATFWSRALLFAGRLYKVHAIQTRFLYFTYKSSSYLTITWYVSREKVDALRVRRASRALQRPPPESGYIDREVNSFRTRAH